MANPTAVFPVHYLGSTRFYAALLQHPEFQWEVWEHFPKQTYRNRCVIYGANGPLVLSVPTERNGERVPLKEQRISNRERWQHLHWRSFESAYRSSPYFEFFEDQLYPFYHKEFRFLLDFNFELHALVTQWLQVVLPGSPTTRYEVALPDTVTDWRAAFPARGANARPETDAYIQVFGDRHGFLSDLSIMDLLFNQGPSGLDFLRQLSVKAEV